jgi:hypothetical protein
MRSLTWMILATVTALAGPVTAQDWKGRARLDGQVTDEDGRPLGGATITIESLARTGGPVVTSDAEGRWTVDGIAAGSWAVEVTAPGYDGRRIGVHLPDESSWLAPLEVRLERAPAEPSGPPAQERATEPEAAEAAPVDADTDGSAVGERARRPEHHEFRAALEAGRIEEAYELLSSLDEHDRVGAEALVAMGNAFLTAGETEAAVTVFDRAVEREPAHAEAHFRRALGLLALGRTEDARADFETVLELGPGGPTAEKARRAIEALPPASAGAAR